MKNRKQKQFTLTQRSVDELDSHPLQGAWVEELLYKVKSAGVPNKLFYVNRKPKGSLIKKSILLPQELIRFVKEQNNASYFLDSLIHQHLAEKGKIASVSQSPNGVSLQQLRKQAGLTVAELASKIGWASSTIYKIERGHLPLSCQGADVLAKFFGVSILDLQGSCEFASTKKAGAIIRDLRKRKGMNQSGLAAITGIPQSAISSLENGKMSLSKKQAEKLASALECPFELFFASEFDEE